jgi:hypothetical protein
MKPMLPPRAIACPNVAIESDGSVGVHHAQAVGTQQHNPVLLGNPAQLGFAEGSLRTDLLESGADDDGGVDADPPACLQHRCHSGCWNGDDRQLDRLRQRFDAGVGTDSADGVGVWVDWVDHPGVAAQQQVLQQQVAHAIGLPRSTDERN